MIELILFLAGVAVGAAGYRYSLKHQPELVEKLAAKIKAKADELRE